MSTRFACQGRLAPLPGGRRPLCKNDAKVQRDGIHYCLIHDPERKKERNERYIERINRESHERVLRSSQQARERAEAIRKQARWDFVERVYRDMKCGDAEMLLRLLGIPIPPDGPDKWADTLAQLVDARIEGGTS